MNDSPEKRSAKTSREKADTLLRSALSKKALDPLLIKLEGITTLTDYFLIVSARSTRQVTAIAEAILEDARKEKIKRFSAEGVERGTWALLDYGDVVVHVFHEPVREFYDLEGLWAEAPREELSEDIKREVAAAAQSDTDEWDEDEWTQDRWE